MALLSIRVDCSKGTYVRVLAEDIGEQLGCGAHLIGLRRTRVGAFTLADAITLDALETLPMRSAIVSYCLRRLVASLPEIALDQDAATTCARPSALATQTSTAPTL